MVWTATSTATAIDRIDIPLCTNTASPTGTLYLDVWSVSNTGNLHAIASSSLDASGNVWYPCGTPNATTTTFIISPQIQVVSGVRILFQFWSDSPPSYTWFTSLNSSSDNRSIYQPAGSTTPFTTTESLYGSSAKSFQYILRATGVAPVSTYTASSTGVICGTFDLGCYISTAFAYLFSPSASIIQDFASTTIQNEFPFSYWYSMQSAFDSAISSSTDQFFVVDFEIMGSTSTILSYPMMQNLVGDDSLDLIRNIFQWILWLCFGFYIYIRMKTIWS
jgi:hypothetical protein